MSLLKASVIFIIVLAVKPAPTPVYLNQNVISCIQWFYTAAEARRTRNISCLGEYDFLSNDKQIQKKAFLDGKSCFLDVTKTKCSSGYKKISENYEDIVNFLTTPPNPTPDSCEGSYYFYESFRCTALINGFYDKAERISLEVDSHETRVTEVLDQCFQAAVCEKSHCFYMDPESAKLSDTCESMALKNSYFLKCVAELEEKRPDVSSYRCLNGTDIYSEDLSVQIELFTTKRGCSRWVMMKHCGEKSMIDFRQNAEIYVKTLEKTIQSGMTG
ncbi:T20D4.11-like domain-containing protein [Caenorhabditis elegans]|uniref:T20D4.11-like domain-containing protein n=1 Tax=Caenorhabditis elegans TaxID=6239 RepID=A0A131MCH2_CAEEL|nr:DUF19 domain-containing protein [Caenorhabditis elegans]CZR14541.1 DUF19 domain-containing protein [Caenorhabditis elegans]|eukprot:NP_001309619.1 Uncharacterized protein CELE_C07G3.15 [Caenorhabditis elegans]